MSFRVSIDGTDRSFLCRDGQAVLVAMTVAGERCVQVGCRSGGCGVCQVQVLSGRYQTGLMSSAKINQQQRDAGHALACKLFPESDLEISVVGRLMRTLSMLSGDERTSESDGAVLQELRV